MKKKCVLAFFIVIFSSFLIQTVQAQANLISVTDGDWWMDSDWSHAPNRAIEIDTANTYNGLLSWKIPLSLTDWSVDHEPFVISPGDTIHFSCYIKTSDPTDPDDIGNPQAGGRIGIDIYSNVGFQESIGIATPNGLGTPTDEYNTYVPFSTSTWTQVSMDFAVAETYVANQGTHVGHTFIPVVCIVWLQTWSSTEYATETGTAWYSNPVLTITDGSPTPTPTPTTPQTTMFQATPTPYRELITMQSSNGTVTLIVVLGFGVAVIALSIDLLRKRELLKFLGLVVVVCIAVPIGFALLF